MCAAPMDKPMLDTSTEDDDVGSSVSAIAPSVAASSYSTLSTSSAPCFLKSLSAPEKRKMRREAKSKAAQEDGEADVSSSSEDEVV